MSGVFVGGTNAGGSANGATFSPEMSGNVIVNTGPGANILILANNSGGTRDFDDTQILMVKLILK
ncbi:hypothetical protein ORL59_27745 [Bacillus cereus]|uniref:hypothetical protein n=1 Tax=Bacillus cereus TaxID=1396 RepID=UPI002ABECC13|nr:hypothetical protein [Bacillus cereus]MDZ4417307.1 hypothetical protein [Bacillus cereus]